MVYLRGASPVAAAGSAETVLQQDTAFVPGMLVVPPGGTVDFGNEDPFFHNVFSYSEAKRFDLGRFPAGQSKSVTFEESGIVKVYCEVHDFMRSVVLVLDTPFHSMVSEDGSFTLRGVPPGDYELVAWHTAFDEQTFPATVRCPTTMLSSIPVGSGKLYQICCVQSAFAIMNPLCIYSKHDHVKSLTNSRWSFYDRVFFGPILKLYRCSRLPVRPHSWSTPLCCVPFSLFTPSPASTEPRPGSSLSPTVVPSLSPCTMYVMWSFRMSIVWT